MKSPISLELLQLAEENDYVVVLDRPGYLMVLKPYGYRDDYFIEDREGSFAVLRLGERETTPTIEMESIRLIDAEKYLSAGLLFGWRTYKLKLPPFTYADQLKDPKRGSRVDLYRESDRATVTWANGTLNATFQYVVDANKFTYYRDASFEQMRAAYADPDGAPLFPLPTEPGH
ncbi:hypothetical protein ABH924_004422 [Arthrobacter sp. GAS37]|uniref:hypothetical protein n=1 Tax=Arthrobacter sp. GAS37 TaxID=3156261 RepID=UPI0038359F34